MSDKQVIMPLESLNKIASYLSTKPWNEVQSLLTLFNEVKELPVDTTKKDKK